MKTKHTQGKWQIRKAIPMKSKSDSIEIKSNDIIAVGINADNDEDFIAVAFCGHCGREEVVANAKLIEAAPELLTLLMECHDSIILRQGENDLTLKIKSIIKSL